MQNMNQEQNANNQPDNVITALLALYKVVNFTNENTSPPSQDTAENDVYTTGVRLSASICLLSLFLGAGLFAKNHRDWNTRKEHVFADRVRYHLSLTGVANFYTTQGRKFLRVMEDIKIELVTQGLVTNNTSKHDIDDIAKKVSDAARNNITKATNFFGTSNITVDQLERKANDIANSVIHELKKEANITLLTSQHTLRK